MKRLIKDSVDNLLEEYSKYYEIDNPDHWNFSDTEEVLKDYAKICEDTGYTYIYPVSAKSQFYDYFGLFADLIAAKDSKGNIRMIYFYNDQLVDVTDDVDNLIGEIVIGG